MVKAATMVATVATGVVMAEEREEREEEVESMDSEAVATKVVLGVAMEGANKEVATVLAQRGEEEVEEKVQD